MANFRDRSWKEEMWVRRVEGLNANLPRKIGQSFAVLVTAVLYSFIVLVGMMVAGVSSLVKSLMNFEMFLSTRCRIASTNVCNSFTIIKQRSLSTPVTPKTPTLLSNRSKVRMPTNSLQRGNHPISANTTAHDSMLQ